MFVNLNKNLYFFKVKHVLKKYILILRFEIFLYGFKFILGIEETHKYFLVIYSLLECT